MKRTQFALGILLLYKVQETEQFNKGASRIIYIHQGRQHSIIAILNWRLCARIDAECGQGLSFLTRAGFLLLLDKALRNWELRDVFSRALTIIVVALSPLHCFFFHGCTMINLQKIVYFFVTIKDLFHFLSDLRENTSIIEQSWLLNKLETNSETFHHYLKIFSDNRPENQNLAVVTTLVQYFRISMNRHPFFIYQSFS